MSDKLDTAKTSSVLGNAGFAGMLKRHAELEPAKENDMTNTDFTGAVSDEILARENQAPLPPKIELIGKKASVTYESSTQDYFASGKILGFTGENIFLVIEESDASGVIETRVTLIPTGRIISISV